MKLFHFQAITPIWSDYLCASKIDMKKWCQRLFSWSMIMTNVSNFISSSVDSHTCFFTFLLNWNHTCSEHSRNCSALNASARYLIGRLYFSFCDVLFHRFADTKMKVDAVLICYQSGLKNYQFTLIFSVNMSLYQRL